MFNGTGYQIHGGTFYNVGGDVNLVYSATST
jgi:hypothetical protein